MSDVDLIDRLRAALDADGQAARTYAQHIGEGWLYALDGVHRVLSIHSLAEHPEHPDCCSWCGDAYPCPTVEAIAEAYGIEP